MRRQPAQPCGGAQSSTSSGQVAGHPVQAPLFTTLTNNDRLYSPADGQIKRIAEVVAAGGDFQKGAAGEGAPVQLGPQMTKSKPNLMGPVLVVHGWAKRR